jgi:hypothetical protein
VIDTNLKEITDKSRTVNIPSNYRVEPTKEAHDDAAENKVAESGLGFDANLGPARPQDRTIDILGDPPPSPTAEYKMGSIYGAISSALARHKTKQDIMEAVSVSAGLGSTTAERVTRFYNHARNEGGADADIGQHMDIGEKRSFTLMKKNAAFIIKAINDIG